MIPAFAFLLPWKETHRDKSSLAFSTTESIKAIPLVVFCHPNPTPPALFSETPATTANLGLELLATQAPSGGPPHGREKKTRTSSMHLYLCSSSYPINPSHPPCLAAAPQKRRRKRKRSLVPAKTSARGSFFLFGHFIWTFPPRGKRPVQGVPAPPRACPPLALPSLPRPPDGKWGEQPREGRAPSLPPLRLQPRRQRRRLALPSPPRFLRQLRRETPRKSRPGCPQQQQQQQSRPGRPSLPASLLARLPWPAGCPREKPGQAPPGRRTS